VSTIAARIRAAAAARIAQILPANGYATSMGQRLYHGRMHFAQADLAAGPIAVLHMPEEATAGDDAESCYQVDTSIIVEAHALPADRDHPALTADILLGDIKRAMLRRDDPRLTDPAVLTDSVRYLRSSQAMPEPGQLAVSVLAEFGVRYSEIYGSPDVLP